MFTTPESTTKSKSIARKQADTSVSFFRKADEPGFFSEKSSGTFFGPPVQAKLNISQPDDPYEKEADQVAETVMRMPDTANHIEGGDPRKEKVQLKEEEEENIQPKLQVPQISSVQCKEEEDSLQAKFYKGLQRKDYGENNEFSDSCCEVSVEQYSVDRKSNSLFQSNVIKCSGRGPPQTVSSFEHTLNSTTGGGSAMSPETRSFMGSRFNANFDDVRIHTGSTAELLSSSIHAQAFTHGNNIYFNSGKYSPNTADGGLLLAHELTHTVQQGAVKTNQTPNIVSRKALIQRSPDSNSSVPQLSNALVKAKGEEGKVNANKEGPDGYREGWERLLEYFKTTFGEDKIISGNGGTAVRGAVSEMDIKKKRQVMGMRPNQPRPSTDDRVMRDAMPSWCGIFVFWALNKGGIPMKKWELGGRMVSPEAARAPGEIPQPGDIAYRNQFSHFAIVEKVTGNTVTTVNGNTSGEDNLGAQVQTRDHPMSGWTAFFDPLKLKTGALGDGGDTQVEEKPKTLKELRKELFHIDRKEDTDQEEISVKADHTDVQAKSSLSNWSVSDTGDLVKAQNANLSQENEIQAKEEGEQEDERFGGLTEHSLQRKTGSVIHHLPFNKTENIAQSSDSGNLINSAWNTGISDNLSSIQKQKEYSSPNRGPPVLRRMSSNSVQCSWFDDAFSAVTSFVADTLEAGKRFFLNEARDFVMAIPGYRALRVILGEDPITGEEIEQNGHTFIEAAFDIMPGGRLLHQKLNELGALNDAAAWVDQQIITVHGLVQGVISRISRFIESLSLERLASPRRLFEEAGDIIYSTIRSIIDFAVTAATELLETVKRFLLTQIVEFVRNHTTAYPLLIVVLGQDPITDEPVERNGTTILNALLELGGEEGIAQRTKMQETGTFQKVAEWIDRGIGVFSDAYDQIKTGFTTIWSRVSIESLMHPVDTFNMIYDQFAAPVQRVWDFVRETAIVILRFIKEVLMRRLSTWARTVRGFALVTVIIGKDPFTDEIVPRTMENLIRGFMSLMEGGEEQFNQLKESGAIERTTARIEAAVARLNMTPAYIVRLFTGLWNSFSLNDLAHPIQAFERIIARFGEPIGRLIAFVVEIIRIVIEVILQVMNFPIALIGNIITKAMQAFDLIKADPVGFLKNLLKAIKQGFVQFFDNILKHLMAGLVGWLTSELKDSGVKAPEDFSLRGIISWVLEVLNITMEKIWEKLAAHPRIGPERVARIRGMINTLEGIWTFIKDVQERGMAAIWDKIKEQLTNLWDTVLGAVKNWIMEQIVNRIVTRLLSMLDPTGIMAVVNSAIALYSAIQSFIKYIREMLEIVNSFVEGVVEIASGNTKRAADYLEGTLARSIPVIIGFLANQVGLSGIGRRIGEMIETARDLVDQALTWLVNKAVDVGGRLLEMGRSAANTVLGWLGFRKTFHLANGEEHELYFDGESPTAAIILASKDPKTLQSVIASKSWLGKSIPDPKVAQIQTEAAYIDARRTNQTVTAGTEIKAAFDRIIAALNTVTGNPVPSTLAAVQETRGSGTALMGRHVFINPLSLNPGGLIGTEPTMDSDMGAELLRRYPGKLVEGHLLNHKLHGPGNQRWNLTPISHATNNAMKLKAENQAKANVLSEGKVISYRVRVNYKADLDPSASTYPEGQIADSIDMTIQELEFKNDSWVPMATQPAWAIAASGNIQHDTSGIPGFGGAVASSKINLNTGSRRDLERLPAIGQTKIDAIIAYRSKNLFTQIDDLLEIEGIGVTAVNRIKDDPNVEV